MAKKPPAFACSACGETVLRWAARCPRCTQMNTIVELTGAERDLLGGRPGGGSASPGTRQGILEFASLDDPGLEPPRLVTGLGEFDRVLGGGIPVGATIVLGGEPGIGKSTLLAQACGRLAATQPVLYVTAEESPHQVTQRFRRLGFSGISGVRMAAGTDAGAIAASIREGQHRLVVVDSIQMVGLAECDGHPGSVAQVRASAAALAAAAKAAQAGLVLVGHVTKDGQLAGPRLLEHLVDVVLAFEGDRYQDLRSLRAVKNRFGPTHEIGLFTMGQTGLSEVGDPSGWFLTGRSTGIPGSCVVPVLEGRRCLLVEVQALVNPTTAPMPQRRVAGCDPNRVAMVLAVLTRRLRIPLGAADVFVNVTGGARIDEPAADLGIALAILGSQRDQAISADLAVIGEVGLGGELRPVRQYELRAAEARRLGFQRLLGPGEGQGRGRLKVADVREAARLVFGEGPES